MLAINVYEQKLSSMYMSRDIRTYVGKGGSILNLF